MTIWYAICDILPIEMLRWDFMRNALLAILLMAPLFGLMSTMIVTGRMSFFSDALGHSAFTGIAIGCICGIAAPIWVAVLFSVVFALLFSYVRSRSNQAADTLIGVFSSAAVALGIFIATMGGGSFTKYNKYLIGDILSIAPSEIGLLALALEPLPNMLILDEPLSGVDVEGQADLMDMLDEIRKTYDLSILMITHDFGMLPQYADKVILVDHAIVKKGTPEEVLNSEEFRNVFRRKGGQV